MYPEDYACDEEEARAISALDRRDPLKVVALVLPGEQLKQNRRRYRTSTR